ncbi:MAG: dihydrodipicolinate synthase family protein [Desulfobacteraceae bacterium]|jgi:dihydrodipicolinate synthase/N-acetylneuraminate lyase
MEVSASPRGLIVDLITPLKKSGDIDGRGLGKHLDGVLPHVQALLLASPQTGEGKNLGPSQRDELLKKALVVVRGQVPILIWITHSTEEETKQNLKLLKKRLKQRKYTGQIFWVDTPLYYHSNRGLPSHYKNLSTTVKEAFLLHNDPELIRQIASTFKRTNIRTSILKELSQMSNIKGLIFLGSLDRARNYQKAVRARTDFRIYDGDESHFLTYPSLSGVVSVGANLAPKAWQKVTASSLNLSGEREEYPDSLQQIWNQGEYLRSLLEIYQNSSAHLIKQVLSDKGILESPTSTVMEESTEEKAKGLKALMERYGDYP